MKSSIFKAITAIIGILGGIGGIVTSNAFGEFNFVILLSSWLSVSLLCLIFYGIASVLEYLEELGAGNKTSEIANDSDTINSAGAVQTQNTTVSSAPIHNIEKASSGDWICPECGVPNKNYVGSCGCGYTKNSNDFWKCPKCNVNTPINQSNECQNCHWKK